METRPPFDYSIDDEGVELPEDSEMTPLEYYQTYPDNFILYPNPFCFDCQRRIEGWPCSGPDPLPYSCPASEGPEMEQWHKERKKRAAGRYEERATTTKNILDTTDDFDFPCSAGVRGIPPPAWDSWRQNLEAWLDQAMKDIEERMNERPPLDRWAAHGSTGSPREVPPRAKIPLTSEGREPQKPKFLGIPEREGRK